jgi:hypothetical protein
MTVSINEIPVASHDLPTYGTLSVKWKCPIPPQYLKAGQNYISVNTRQRSIDPIGVPCQDEDNAGNWLRFEKTSAFYIKRRELGTYSIVNYPFPYFDHLATNPVQATLVVSPDATDSVLSAMLDLASDVGYKTELPMSMRVRADGQLDPGRQSVFVGLTGTIPYPSNVPLNSGIGAVSAFDAGGKPQLSIIGKDAAGLSGMMNAVSSDDLVPQMEGTTVVLADKIESDQSPGLRARLGSFPFSDLNIPPILLSGGFHHHQTLTVMRPIRTDLGRDSEIRIHFRHSASLNPLRSLFTIYMNGIPIASGRLDPSNANGGIVTAVIPIDQLHHSRWIFDFDVYHDLGSADCSKTYEDVAWTVIEPDSAIELKPGLLPGHPYLEDFPYLIPKTGETPASTAMLLSAHPSDIQYSLAASLAARAAQTNGLPVKFDVVRGEIPTSLPSVSAVIIGYYSEADRFAGLQNILLAAPGPRNEILIQRSLRLLHAPLRDGVLVQAVNSPTSTNGVYYVVLAPDDDALARFNHFLSSPKAKDLLAGQVLLYTRDGRALQLDVTTNTDRAGEEAIEDNRSNSTMTMIKYGIGALLVIFIIWVGMQFRKKSGSGDSQAG